MDFQPTQENRLAELTTPLGKDVLLLSSFNLVEELGTLFEIKIDCLSTKANIDFGRAIGQNATIKLLTAGKVERYFSGVLVEAMWVGEREHLSAYQLTLRPWFWLLTQKSDCRIFQNKSVVDIIKEVITGFPYEVKLSGSYKKIEYCVQYRETSFNFVSRLMEHFGIYYFFKHSKENHTMVIADSKSSHQAIPNLASCLFSSMGARVRQGREHLREWHSGRKFGTGKVTVNAFDFAKPTANLIAETSGSGGYAHDRLEIYDYPEKYKQGEESDLGKTFANAKLQSIQALDRRRFSSGEAPSLFPGGLTTLEKHRTPAENKEYLVVSAMHSFVGESFIGGGDGGGERDSYFGSYVMQPSDRPFKAPLVTPRPIIYGPQTAIVVGPKGEEIYTDKHGRVKLKFHWDRESKSDEHSSRWVRIAQVWSGKGWGGIFIPRIGMEVVVEFIEGDPDRPLIVGAVYNGDNVVPYELGKNKTQGGLKSRSTKSATTSQYNEFMFEDKKGSEFVRFHAEKDLDATIEDAEKRLIQGKNKETGKTTRDTKIEKGDDVLVIDGDNHVTIGRHQTVTVGNNITIEAGSQIVLKVGKSLITMTPASITLEAQKITIKSNITEIDAGTLLKQTGGVITLN